MATRDDLCEWVVEAINHFGGQARIVPICKYIWGKYENELKRSGDLFYTWQYEVRWAGQKLRDSGTLLPAHNNRQAPWAIKK